MDANSAQPASRGRSKGKISFASSEIYGVITRWSLYVLFFLLPIFFLPWTLDALEINKQTLLVVLTLVALVAWLGSMVIEKKLAFRKGWLNVVPLLFIVSVLVSSVFSLAGYQTWVGQSVQEYTSFLSFAMFVLLFYVLTNTAGSIKVQKNLFFATLLSSTLAGILTTFAMFGINLLPFAAASRGMNTVGTINGYATFMIFAMVLGLGLWLVSKKGKEDLFLAGVRGKLSRIMVMLVTLMTVIALVAIDFWVLWVIAIFGLLLLFAFAFLQQKEFPEQRRFGLPLIIVLVGVLFLFISSPLNFSLPVVVSPSYSTSFNIARQAIMKDIPSTILGSGPGTFSYDYSSYKPATINNSRFWNSNFDRAKSHAITMLATLGVIGTLLLGVFVIWLGLRALSRLMRDRDAEEWKLTYVLFSGWATLVLAHLLYSSNMTLHFLFWAFTGLIASQVLVKVKQSSFGESPKLGMVFSFAFVVVAVGVVTTLFVTGQRYAAEAAFTQAVRADRSGEAVEVVIQKLQTATKHNSLSDIYYRNLSQALLLRTSSFLQEAGGISELTAEQTQQLQTLVQASVASAARASELEPNQASNWYMRGSVYRNLLSIVNNANNLAAASFARAGELEPASPLSYTNIAQVNLAMADRAKVLQGSDNAEVVAQAQELEVAELAAAEENLTRAIELKPDHAPAHYYLAAVMERQGRLTDAVARMEALRNFSPLDLGIGFQLAQLYLRTQNMELARAELERLVNLRPTYSNARWYLASVYEVLGDTEAAIEQVQAVVDLNPENELVLQRLANLRDGETSLRIPVPVEAGEQDATTVEEGEIEEVPES